MKILIACEESQAVTTAIRRLGHEAYSCDLFECSGGHPEWHIQGDCLPLLNGRCEFDTMDGVHHVINSRWDMLIAFPPCTHLASSGARHFEKKRADGRQQKAIEFFMRIVKGDCDKIAIENPIGIMSKQFRKPDQIIQPWMFGDNVQKSTCLWLKGVDKLIPDVAEKPEIKYREWIDKKTGKKKRQTEWYYATRCAKHSERGKVASKTFPGIANAIAAQWVKPLEIEEFKKGESDGS